MTNSNQAELIDSITKNCVRCGGLCCQDYYSKLQATGFGRTKKRLILDESFRRSITAGIEELALDKASPNARSLSNDFNKIDFNDLPIRILPQLKIFDDYYKSCSPNGPCGFFRSGMCLIHETKEYKCEAFYCAKSSYKGKASDLQTMIDNDFTAADIFALHMKQVSKENLLALIDLELMLFQQMPRMESSHFLEPKIIVNGEEMIPEVKKLLQHAKTLLRIIEVRGDIETLNRTCLKYFDPDFFNADLVFILLSEETDLAKIKNILLLQPFPSLLFLTCPPGKFHTSAETAIDDSHFHLASYGLHTIAE